MAKDYVYLPESLWGKLGKMYDDQKERPRTSADIIKQADLDWEVGSLPMFTEAHKRVQNWHAIYRVDDNSIIGAVNKAYPDIVQNVNTFDIIESRLGNALEVETAGHLSGNKDVFGCFKVQEEFKLFDDEIDQFFVILNDHMKPDGKVTVLYTPVRVVCQNTLSYALNNNAYKARISISPDKQINHNVGFNVMSQIEYGSSMLEKKSNIYRKLKIDRDDIESLLDDLFPIVESGIESSHEKANEQMDLARSTFISECMNRDDLGNYRGTGYQVFQAITDFSQHYFTNTDKMYDLTYRMNMLPGQGIDTQGNLIKKTVVRLNKWADQRLAA